MLEEFVEFVVRLVQIAFVDSALEQLSYKRETKTGKSAVGIVNQAGIALTFAIPLDEQIIRVFGVPNDPPGKLLPIQSPEVRMPLEINAKDIVESQSELD